MANFTNIELQFNTQCTKLINNFFATNNNPDPNYINQEVTKASKSY